MWIGFAVGALVGLMILFVIDKLDDRIGSFVEFGAHYPEHILGQIPSENMTGELALLKHSDARHSLLESYRTLRSSLLRRLPAIPSAFTAIALPPQEAMSLLF